MKRGLVLRPDLIGVCCDAFARIFAGHHDSLIKQALDCKLVEELLAFLDSPAADMEQRALIVKALKSMTASLAHGERVQAILKASPVWKQFEAQRHDLFIKNEGAVAAITAAPGVAGYLTSTAKPTPMAPPPMEAPPGGAGAGPGANSNPLL